MTARPMATGPVRRPAATATPAQRVGGALTPALVQPRRVPGPKRYRRLRLWLTIAIVASAVLSAVAISLADSSLRVRAQAEVYSQYLTGLTVDLAKARAYGLLALADPANLDWVHAADSAARQVDATLADITVTAPSSGRVAELLTATRLWQARLSQLGVVDPEPDQIVLGSPLDLETSAYSQLDLTVTGLIEEAPSDFPSQTSSTIWLGLALAGVCLAGLAVLIGLILIARRSHRVVNLGLVIALGCLTATAVILGGDVPQPTAAAASSASDHALAAQILIWDVLSDDAVALMDDPVNAGSHLDQAASRLDQAANLTFTAWLRDLSAQQDQIGASDDQDRPVAIATAIATWDSTDQLLAAAHRAPATPRPTLNWQLDLGLVIALGLVALLGVLGGIHRRIKEYQ